jgi:CheY-like chemotaxis protein
MIYSDIASVRERSSSTVAVKEPYSMAVLSTHQEVYRVVGSGAKRPVILIVEDELLIRMDAADMVRTAGFDVVEAQNADEAILVLERRFDIAVVFTDIQMPGSMDGLKLAAAIRGRWPPIKIVAASGLVQLCADDLPAGSHILSKPYSAGQIVGAIRQLTGEI